MPKLFHCNCSQNLSFFSPACGLNAVESDLLKLTMPAYILLCGLAPLYCAGCNNEGAKNSFSFLLYFLKLDVTRCLPQLSLHLFAWNAVASLTFLHSSLQLRRSLKSIYPCISTAESKWIEGGTQNTATSFRTNEASVKGTVTTVGAWREPNTVETHKDLTISMGIVKKLLQWSIS